jgi:hypothetical protein
MNPSPEQWRAFRRAAFDAWLSNKKNLGQYSDAMDCYVEGYVFAKSEQATEIAALKAQIEHLKQVVIHDRIEWEDFPPASHLAFAQLLKD